MTRFAGSFFAGVFGVLALLFSISLTSCTDQYPPAAILADTVTHHDTLAVRDTVILRDTLDVDDSNIWIYRTSGTTQNLVVVQYVDPASCFIGGGTPPSGFGDGVALNSGDRGSSWQLACPNVGTTGSGGNVVYGLSFLDALNGFAVGDGPNVFQTTDGGHTWSPTPSGSSMFLRSIWFLDYRHGFYGTSDPQNFGSGPGSDGEIWSTSDGGNSWNLATTTNGGIYCIHFITPSNGVAMGRFGVVLWTSDGGNSWNSGTSDQTGATTVVSRMAFTTGGTGFASCYIDQTHGAILRTDDNGHTWRTIQAVPFGISGMATNGNGTLTACGEGGAIIESTDAGTTWHTSNLGTSRWIDVTYAGSDRTVLVGVGGQIATRDK